MSLLLNAFRVWGLLHALFWPEFTRFRMSDGGLMFQVPMPLSEFTAHWAEHLRNRQLWDFRRPNGLRVIVNPMQITYAEQV